ncbi:MAG: ThuA domain-containing protein [Acidobacteria bacterium]|nr:ThuA domain-containing protein [Acidobacteriota bacterium]
MLRRTALEVLAGAACAAGQGIVREPTGKKPTVVFASGETGNHSDTALARIAGELESANAMRCRVIIANSPKDFPDLEMIEDADLAVFYLESLELPAAQMQYVRSYAGSGKPLVALRTTLQAFRNWPEFGEQVLGAQWHYDYGRDSSTEVRVIPGAASHPILQSVPAAFRCRSPLYHVLPLRGSPKLLLMGKPVGPSDRTERVDNPVAWTTSYKGGRVFYTSLGAAPDFEVEPFRRLLVNAVYWALGRVR